MPHKSLGHIQPPEDYHYNIHCPCHVCGFVRAVRESRDQMKKYGGVFVE